MLEPEGQPEASCALPNQAKSVQQEAKTKEERVITEKNKPGQSTDNNVPSSKEVSHQKLMLT